MTLSPFVNISSGFICAIPHKMGTPGLQSEKAGLAGR